MPLTAQIVATTETMASASTAKRQLLWGYLRKGSIRKKASTITPAAAAWSSTTTKTSTSAERLRGHRTTVVGVLANLTQLS
jgi:hypothetical protein